MWSKKPKSKFPFLNLCSLSKNRINLLKAFLYGRFPFLKKKGAGFTLQSFLRRKGFTLQSLTQKSFHNEFACIY